MGIYRAVLPTKNLRRERGEIGKGGRRGKIKGYLCDFVIAAGVPVRLFSFHPFPFPHFPLTPKNGLNLGVLKYLELCSLILLLVLLLR